MISVESLRSLKFFAGVGADSLKAVSQIAEELTFEAGQMLFEEGQPSEYLYMVQQGEIDIVYKLQGGEECVVDTVIGGDLVGWSSLVEPFETTATATARSAGHAVRIHGPALRELCDQDTQLGYALMQHIADALSTRLQGALVQLAAAG